MLLASAFFSGMEIAFVSANRLKVELDKKKGLISGRIIAAFVSKPSFFIAALLLGNNIALVIYGIFMARELSFPLPDALNNDFVVLVLQTIASTLIILFTAEFLPKVLFRIKSNQILHFFALPVFFFYAFLYPITRMFISISSFFLKHILRLDIKKEIYAFSPIDLDNYIKDFYIKTPENQEVDEDLMMFQNVIGFKEVKLRECMIPRPEIDAIEISEGIKNLKDLFVESGRSKILVYDDSIDNIIGYTHSFDLLSDPKNIRSILRQTLIVPETMLAQDLLQLFIKKHKTIAVVVDEFGGTSGMLTMEDVLEEILGEIYDEYDTEEFTDKKIGENEYLFSGRLEIDYINEKYFLDIPESEEYKTIAGFVLQHYESIPQLNEIIQIEKMQFHIMQVTETKIEKLKLIISE
jgi:putative hemolysin